MTNGLAAGQVSFVCDPLPPGFDVRFSSRRPVLARGKRLFWRAGGLARLGTDFLGTLANKSGLEKRPFLMLSVAKSLGDCGLWHGVHQSRRSATRCYRNCCRASFAWPRPNGWWRTPDDQRHNQRFSDLLLGE